MRFTPCELRTREGQRHFETVLICGCLRSLQIMTVHMAKSEVSAVTWAQSEDRGEKVFSGLRAQVQMDLLANPNLQCGEVALHRKKMDLLFQLIQLKRETQAFKINELENSPEAQVGAVTFLDSESLQVKTKSGNGSKEKESV